MVNTIFWRLTTNKRGVKGYRNNGGMHNDRRNRFNIERGIITASRTRTAIQTTFITQMNVTIPTPVDKKWARMLRQQRTDPGIFVA